MLQYAKQKDFVDVEIYDSIKKKDRGESIEADYKDSFIGPIMRDQNTNKYFVFPTIELAEKFYTEIENTPNLHEVAPPNSVICVYFDFDLKLAKYKFTKSEAKELTDELLARAKKFTCELIKEFRNNGLVIDPKKLESLEPNKSSEVTPDNYYFRVFSSNSEEVFSYHLLTPLYCENRKVAKYCADIIRDRLIDSLDVPELEQIVDGGTLKPWANLRMCGSSKTEDPTRIKQSAEELEFQDTLIVWHDRLNPPAVFFQMSEKFSADNFVLDRTLSRPDDQEGVERIAMDYLRNFSEIWSFRSETNGLYWYDRNLPSYCEICKVTHDKDNTLFFTIGPHSTRPVYMHCIRKTGDKSEKIKIGNLEATSSSTILERQKYLEENLPKIPKASDILHRWCVKNGLAKQSYLEDSPDLLFDKLISKESEKSTFVIRANMKMGKTKTLINYIISASERGIFGKNPKILFISFRRTFTQSLLARLNSEMAKFGIGDFKSYKDIDYQIALDVHPRCIVQVDSLHRITPGDSKPDLLILDEVESILSQFSSNLIRDLNNTYSVFEWLMSYSRKIICMDANVTTRTLEMLKKWQGKEEIILYQNVYKNASEDKYHILKSSKHLIKVALKKLADGKKIVICSNSLSEAKTFREAITEIFSDKLQIGMYSGETSPTQKDKHFSDVDLHWSKLDVLIYTPTVSAGVSYEEKHFDCLLAYFTSDSCDVETARQMIGRVRNLADRDYYIAFDSRRANYPTNKEEISRYLRYNREELRKIGIRDSIAPPLEINYDEYGDCNFKKLNFYDLWIQNICHKNKSLNDYFLRFCSQVTEIGAKIDYLEDEDEMPEIDLGKCREQVQLKRGEEIVSGRHLPDDQYNQIRKIIDGTDKSGSLNLTQSDMNSYTKTFLCKVYSLKLPALCSETDFALASFLEKGTTLKIYKNLCDVRQIISLNDQPPPNSALDEALEILRGKDIRKFEDNRDSITFGVELENRAYRHFEIWRILKYLGYDYIGTQFRMPLENYNEKIEYLSGMNSERVHQLSMLFGIKPRKDAKFISDMIWGMYGLTIKKDQKHMVISHNPTLVSLALNQI